MIPAVAPHDVVWYLRLADVLVTTRARGTNVPLKIYQYLRAERPIVATDIRSHTQTLEPGTAELVQPNASAIADGVVRVLTNPYRARELADNAGRLARERFGEEVYLARLDRLMSQLPVSTRKSDAAAAMRGGR
jgi:glycosyltransferase involved in cell wall biosynthesis